MSSSPINDAQESLTLYPPAAPSGRDAERGSGSDSHRRWFKRALPRSLWGRSLLITILPLVLTQILATWFFYDRVWDTVARRLSAAVAAEISFTLSSLAYADTSTARQQMLQRATDVTELFYGFRAGETLPEGMQLTTGGYVEEQLAGGGRAGRAAISDRRRFRSARPARLGPGARGRYGDRGAAQAPLNADKLHLRAVDDGFLVGAAGNRIGVHAQPDKIVAPACDHGRFFRQRP
jgi:hypothetical protein